MNNIITHEQHYINGLSQRIKQTLMALGFDYGLIGTHYLQEVILKVIIEPNKIHCLSSKVMQEMISLENKSIKFIDKDIRWAIRKAYNIGALGQISFFAGGQMPTNKQFINWLYDYFM